VRYIKHNLSFDKVEMELNMIITLLSLEKFPLIKGCRKRGDFLFHCTASSKATQ
jgi:hypothetical protein